MNPKVGVPIMVLLLMASSWAFSNEEVIDEWVRENQLVVEPSSEELLEIQAEEQWLVLVADFPNQRASDAWGIDQAQNMLDDIAQSYISQLTANSTNLTVIVHPEVSTASEDVAAYGQDNGGNRDTDSSGSFLPMSLAEEVVLDQASSINWSQFDLDGDLNVDRLLILHTTKGQEETPAQTEKIWSHFTHFDEALEVGSGYTVAHYTMASLRTGSSGMGTVMHEMMHQMGALDLYPVHDSSLDADWHGVGNWDIMASGNWNGGGVWPALGTAPTMELIGLDRFSTMDLTWPTSSVAPCVGPNVSMEGMSEGGMALKIPINQEETVWVERHTDYGFDRHLPGHGLLVTVQDLSVGDEDRNELNRDSEQPWLAVVEADGRNDMRSGLNDGEQSDLFLNGTSFGAEGVEIRDHDGFLVPWTATVFGTENLTIQFTAPACTPAFSGDGPDFGAVILPADSYELELTTGEPCNLSHTLGLSDGRGVEILPSSIETGTTLVELRFSWNGTANSETLLQGTITCGEGILDLSTSVLTLARIPQPELVVGILSVEEDTRVKIPIQSTGEGTQSFTLDLDGPMSRVGTIENRVVLEGSDFVTIEIEPNDLLLDGMKVRGQLIFIDGNGHRWIYELDFTAQEGEATTLEEWRTPGRILSAVCLVVCLWVLLGIFESGKKDEEEKGDDSEQQRVTIPQEVVSPAIDPWGRPVDEFE